MPRVIATLPTYNEAENIEKLIGELRAMNVEVLVADDNSPDGTWRIVADLAKGDQGVHLLHRTKNRGRGYAGAEGYRVALELGADRVVEMDADLSHRTEYIPDLLAKLDQGADIAVGSRLVPGGKDARGSWARRLLTRFSCWYARTVLRLPLRDANSGFRVFTRRALESVEPATLQSAGPSIVHEVYVRAREKGLRMVEAPITFVEREEGNSELDVSRLLDGFRMVWRLRKIKKFPRR